MENTKNVSVSGLGSLRKRRIPSGERRIQLLDAARDLIVRDGVSAVTMSSLADYLKIGKPIVYSHFKNSEEVLIELLRKHGEESMFRASERVRGARTVYEYLDRTIDSMFDHIKADGSIARRITNGFSSREKVDSYFRGLLERSQRAYCDLLLQQGVPEKKATTAAYALMEMINMTIYEIAEKGDTDDRDTLKVMVKGAVRSLVGGRGVKPRFPELT